MRSNDQIREHYEIEVELANRLKQSTKKERIGDGLYTKVYDELLERVPHHQLLSKKKDADRSIKPILWQLALVKRFLTGREVFLEVGAGDCALSFKACPLAERVYGLDVSNVITEADSHPSNFDLIISDGVSVPLPDSSVDVAYSNQLMEHVHPDDAKEQLAEIVRVLAPGGRYVCVTPNKANGPWDISYYFDDMARGFHLKEYTASELVDLFKQAGLKNYRAYIGARSYYMRFPVVFIIALEKLIMSLPGNLRLSLGRSLPVRAILGVRLVGIK